MKKKKVYFIGIIILLFLFGNDVNALQTSDLNQFLAYEEDQRLYLIEDSCTSIVYCMDAYLKMPAKKDEVKYELVEDVNFKDVVSNPKYQDDETFYQALYSVIRKGYPYDEHHHLKQITPIQLEVMTQAALYELTDQKITTYEDPLLQKIYEDLLVIEEDVKPVDLSYYQTDDARMQGLLKVGIRQYRLQLEKCDKTHQPLFNSRFELIDEDEKVIKIDLEDVSMTSIVLPCGSYVLKEIQAPQYYETVDDIHFEIKHDGSIMFEKDYPYINFIDHTLQIINQKSEYVPPISRTSFSFYKKDVYGKPVEDMIFCLQNKWFEYLATSDQDGYVEFCDLMDGEYELFEIDPSDRFQTSLKKICIEDGLVYVDDVLKINPFTWINDYQPIAITLYKHNESFDPLENIEFSLYDHSYQFLEKQSTDCFGKISFCLKDGIYYLKESGQDIYLRFEIKQGNLVEASDSFSKMTDLSDHVLAYENKSIQQVGDGMHQGFLMYSILLILSMIFFKDVYHFYKVHKK